jgi:hypothetical protein
LAVLALLLVSAQPARQVAGARMAHRVATSLATLAAGVLLTDYGIQLMVVQPSLVKKETEGLGLWSQLNPHGVFIALQNIDYLLLALAFVSLGAAMTYVPGSSAPHASCSSLVAPSPCSR